MDQSCILLRKEYVNVFRLPTVALGRGHLLDSWKDKLWAGELLVRTDNIFLSVELRTTEGSLYARAKVPEDFGAAVEKCTDSSRGFALRLTADDGRLAWVGLVFHDRNAAFDFWAVFEEQLRRRKLKTAPPVLATPQLDLGLRKGGKMKLGFQPNAVATDVWDFGKPKTNPSGHQDPDSEKVQIRESSNSNPQTSETTKNGKIPNDDDFLSF